MENNKKPDNPWAFPLDANTYLDEYKGMTLRDYFADSASKVIPIKEINKGFRVNEDYDNWAKECYKRADALLKQREL
jgi:hypothetical protein